MHRVWAADQRFAGLSYLREGVTILPGHGAEGKEQWVAQVEFTPRKRIKPYQMPRLCHFGGERVGIPISLPNANISPQAPLIRTSSSISRSIRLLSTLLAIGLSQVLLADFISTFRTSSTPAIPSAHHVERRIRCELRSDSCGLLLT